ncbi:MAG: DNA-processing protein DprA [Eubacteriales bacterium]|jgi:DNA processing protein
MGTENLYWVWLSCRLGAANCDFVRLVLRYDNPYDIYRADQTELSQIDGISEQTANALMDKRLDEAAGIIGYCAGAGVGILPFSHPDYPGRLRMLKDPSVLLYVRGRLPQMDKLVCIAVVGTRRMSEYGRESAYRIAYELGAAGAVVVSGMALGIDGVAACGALTGRGKTVAVLGSGIDVIYPREHAKLMQLISENGAVVTEYPPGTPPAREHFPVRNRIISGMCQGTLVVEADAKSGAMITARIAHEQGRQVFAIPGNLGEENTEGTNQLIRDRAIVVIETEDILREYEYLYGMSIDTARLAAARKKYRYGNEVFLKMGVSARLAPGRPAPKSNKPSAPAEAFRKKKDKTADNQKEDNKPEKTEESKPNTKKLTAGDYIESARKPTAQDEKQKARTDDAFAAVLASLDEKYRRLLEAMPADRAVPLDALAKLGFSIGEVISAMTMLEVKGLVSSLPGGLYIRR